MQAESISTSLVMVVTVPCLDACCCMQVDHAAVSPGAANAAQTSWTKSVMHPAVRVRLDVDDVLAIIVNVFFAKAARERAVYFGNRHLQVRVGTRNPEPTEAALSAIDVTGVI